MAMRLLIGRNRDPAVEGLFQVILDNLVYSLYVAYALFQQVSQLAVLRDRLEQFVPLQLLISVSVKLIENFAYELLELEFLIQAVQISLQDIVEFLLGNFPVSVIVAQLNEHFA